MKITYAGLVLADVDTRAALPRVLGPLQPPGVQIGTRRLSEVVPIYRKATSNVFARKNSATTVSFTSIRLFGTVDDAEQFAATHESDLPDSGDLLLRSSGVSGFSMTLAGAVLERVQCTPYGASCQASYEFVGMRVT